ncbi:HEAT repeat domain-containing protein [Aggregatilinea lenta]|uniref:HEAT repeat domain-containing protein n=1 Tax=Aggregatilinea lenta TaxID=913108 RepID=UPI000E5B9B9B|nr:HEAT repeat domain-containing protein [Aggregatilinea lenta]
MRLNTLIASLAHPTPSVRLDVVRVLGMVEETRALDALRAQLATEADPDIRAAIQWAGQRLYSAQQAGYSTIDALFEHFNINREIEHAPDEAEAELLRKMDSMFDKDLQRMKEQAAKRRAGTALAAGLGGMMAGGALTGMGMMSASLAAGADVAGSNLSVGGMGSVRRVPPTAPATTDIAIRVRRLREDTKASNRTLTATELAQINNPQALPALAAAYLLDPVPEVRQAAERFGKILYWSMFYWEMEQSGEIAAEMKRRREALGSRTQQAPNTPPPPSPATSEDAAEILRRAQENRAKRKKS